MLIFLTSHCCLTCLSEQTVVRPLPQSGRGGVLVQEIPGGPQDAPHHQEHHQGQDQTLAEANTPHFPSLRHVDKVLRIDVPRDHDVGPGSPQGGVRHGAGQGGLSLLSHIKISRGLHC